VGMLAAQRSYSLQPEASKLRSRSECSLFLPSEIANAIGHLYCTPISPRAQLSTSSARSAATHSRSPDLNGSVEIRQTSFAKSQGYTSPNLSAHLPSGAS
jgi:hypothetical protein